MEYFHIDALRLDAIHAIYDMSAVTFLENLELAVEEYGKLTGRKRYLIAESDRNDPRIGRPRINNGYGLDAQWCDDLHHALHAAITGERLTYYEDYGSCAEIAKALCQGFVHDGTYSAYRKRRHGAPATELESVTCVVCSQNHDQVGNRAFGERLLSLSSPQWARLSAASVILSPMIPLLFMGEEWGEKNPFLYFVDHSDPALCDAVREGRKNDLPNSFQENRSLILYWLQHLKCPGSAGKKKILFLESILQVYYRELIRFTQKTPGIQ
jgi:maltooligosyltrehalose trehalohydrolase